MIDDALLRPGRLEVHVEIGLPDEAGRLQILQIHTRGMVSGGLGAVRTLLLLLLMLFFFIIFLWTGNCKMVNGSWDRNAFKIRVTEKRPPFSSPFSSWTHELVEKYLRACQGLLMVDTGSSLGRGPGRRVCSSPGDALLSRGRLPSANLLSWPGRR